MKTRPLLRLFAAAVLTCAAVALAAEKVERKPAPAWELKDLDGKMVKSSDFKGKVVLLDFWATWCPPCREEIPGFVSLQKKHGDKGLVVVGVSLDDEGVKGVKDFVAKNKINYPIVMGDGKTTELFGGVKGIPTTFIIDKKGNIVGKHVGFTEEKAFEKEVLALLK